MEFEVERMEPLFATEADFKEFKNPSRKASGAGGDLASYQGKAFLESMPVLQQQSSFGR